MIGTMLDVRNKNTDYNQLISPAMEANAYLIGTNAFGSHKAIWKTRLHIACVNATKGSFSVKKGVNIHDSLNLIVNELRSNFNVDGFHLLLRHLGKHL